jgi:hypothetical protein
VRPEGLGKFINSPHSGLTKQSLNEEDNERDVYWGGGGLCNTGLVGNT